MIMGVCKLCRKESELISSFLGLCRDCIINKRESLKFAKLSHIRAREKFGLTPEIPKDPKGLPCFGCGNECKISKNERGYCGLVENRNGKIMKLAGTKDKGLCSFYYDSLPTNCVASPFCEGSEDYGCYNLAVFYGACNFDCLFCQNWEFKKMTKDLKPLISAKDLAKQASERTSCVCYFGGNPDPQLPHAIESSKLMLKSKGNKIRICMESNGNANWNLLERFAKISFKSGGCIKFDLKAWNKRLNLALTGISNKTSLKNFERLAKFHHQRKEFPFLIASTLLVPGYMTPEEIGMIARFIANLDPSIPYSLLGFYPMFFMDDLPLTSRKFAMDCLGIAKEAGLENVRIGNAHLLK
jgi:pyruvate formate lyase activating enzyme